jgi:hypothetical protein
MPNLLVDDDILLRILLGRKPTELDADGDLFTTGLWYHRLSRAVARPAHRGAFTRRIDGATPETASLAIRSIIELPASIGLISLRDLGWPMATLVAEGARLNLLSLEALSAARELDATIWLSRRGANPGLIDAAESIGRAVRILAA